MVATNEFLTGVPCSSGGARRWPIELKVPGLWHELRPVFRTVCLLTLRGHFPSHIFESLFWRFVADA